MGLCKTDKWFDGELNRNRVVKVKHRQLHALFGPEDYLKNQVNEIKGPKQDTLGPVSVT